MWILLLSWQRSLHAHTAKLRNSRLECWDWLVESWLLSVGEFRWNKPDNRWVKNTFSRKQKTESCPFTHKGRFFKSLWWRCFLYLCIEDRHYSVFGFPYILPLPAHLDVWIWQGKKRRADVKNEADGMCLTSVEVCYVRAWLGADNEQRQNATSSIQIWHKKSPLVNKLQCVRQKLCDSNCCFYICRVSFLLASKCHVVIGEEEHLWNYIQAISKNYELLKKNNKKTKTNLELQFCLNRRQTPSPSLF